VSAKKARDLADGDLIDLSGVDVSAYIAFAGDKATNDEFEYARVGSESGPHTAFKPGVLWLHTSQGSIEVGEDVLFEVEGADR
jgi:hypothetical protein